MTEFLFVSTPTINKNFSLQRHFDCPRGGSLLIWLAESSYSKVNTNFILASTSTDASN